MDHTCHSRVFSTVTRLLTLTESIAEVPYRQVAKSANRFQSSFFVSHSTTMNQAITIIQTRRSATGFGLVHPHHSVLKQLKPFSSDSQALEASTCRYTPFCALNDGYAYTGNAACMDELFCLDAYNTWSTLYDGPKVSCCSYVIIVRTLIQLLDHYRPY